jgi:hypothetical protein
VREWKAKVNFRDFWCEIKNRVVLRYCTLGNVSTQVHLYMIAFLHTLWMFCSSRYHWIINFSLQWCFFVGIQQHLRHLLSSAMGNLSRSDFFSFKKHDKLLTMYIQHFEKFSKTLSKWNEFLIRQVLCVGAT